jgi:hypothetical protein
MAVQTNEGLPVIAVDIIGRMPSALYMRLFNRGQCPRTYTELFVAHALQYDADSTEYMIQKDIGTYRVTIPDNLSAVQRVVAEARGFSTNRG